MINMLLLAETGVSSPASLADGVGTILDGVGSAGQMVWGLFSNFLTMITSNALIFVPVGLAILAGAIGIAVKMVRKFGVRGKR